LIYLKNIKPPAKRKTFFSIGVGHPVEDVKVNDLKKKILDEIISVIYN